MNSYVLPYPPSANGYWRSFRGRQIISERGREYRKQGLAMIAEQGIADLMECALSVAIELYPPDKRRRDIDNGMKALLDLITHAGVWVDDSQIKRLAITMHDPDHEYSGTATIQIKPFIAQ